MDEDELGPWTKPGHPVQPLPQLKPTRRQHTHTLKKHVNICDKTLLTRKVNNYHALSRNIKLRTSHRLKLV